MLSLNNMNKLNEIEVLIPLFKYYQWCYILMHQICIAVR